MPYRGQLPLDAVAARPGLVTEPKLGAAPRQLGNQRLQGGRRVRNLPILAHFPPLARIGQRDRDRILVNIQADVVISWFMTRLSYA